MKPNSFLFCLVFALCAHPSTTAYAQAVNKQDSLALVDLYNSTKGPNWINHTNWLTRKPVKTWYGITVRGTRITEIDLSYINLTGNIPSSVGNLVNLTSLWLVGNKLNGNIPSSFGNLKNLQALYLGSNQLSGTITSSLGNLVNLAGINLESNQLTGSILSSIGNLVNLVDLDLGNNQLSGGIPPSIGNLVKLRSLLLDRNQLSGSIPSSIGNLVKLRSLYLYTNNLSGPIPSSIGNLKGLELLQLYGNHLSGQVPSSMLNLLTNLEELGLDNNNFTFDGIERIVEKFACGCIFTYFTYAPQALITVHQHGNALSVFVGGKLIHNTYKWYRGGTLVATITGDSVFHPSQSGIYTVSVTNSVATALTLKSKPINYVASSQFTAASPSSENATQRKIMNSFSVYPNPAKDILHVQTSGKATITLTDQSGKILFTKNINGREEINVANLAAGLHYLKNNETGAVQKVVVEK